MTKPVLILAYAGLRIKAVDLPDVSKALGQCQNLVSHFNRSTESTNLFKKKQTDLKHKSLCLIQEVAQDGTLLITWLSKSLANSSRFVPL